MADLVMRNFTTLDQKDLELVLSWRNSDRVRLMMENPEPIALADHLAYVARLPQMPDRRYYLVCIDELPIGVVDYTEMIPGAKRCNTGLYLGEGAPFGAGLLLEHVRYHGLYVRFGYPEAYSLMRKENDRYRKVLMRMFKVETIRETEDYYEVWMPRERWQVSWDENHGKIFSRFAIRRVVWKEPEGEIVSFEEKG